VKGLDHLAVLFGQPVMGGTRRQGKVAIEKRQLDDKSRMTGDCHVRFPESVGVKFPRATPLNRSQKKYNIFLKRIQYQPYSLFLTYWNILVRRA